ncbi:MAG: hypothetical protein HRT61_24290 [Ekhidna sp.]|nr:hypothetical protein [Ekhidna sp.]
MEMLPDILKLDEVVVSGKKEKFKRINLGKKVSSSGSEASFLGASLGHEIGELIPVDNKTVFIESLQFNIKRNTDLSLRYRLNLYEMKGNMPGNKINSKNIIFPIDVRRGKFRLNLKEYNLSIDRDFYCTIELIEKQDSQDAIVFPIGFTKGQMILRTTSQSEWEESFKGFGIGFQFSATY